MQRVVAGPRQKSSEDLRARCRRETSFTGGERKNALPNCLGGEQ
jgi:hypothetical protein